MALALAEKHKVIYYLGWSGQTIVAGSTQYNSVVDNRLSKNLNTQIESIVRGLLTRLETLDKRLDDAACRLSASEVDGITLNADEILKLKRERRRWMRELSQHLDIPLQQTDNINVGVTN